MDRSDPGRRALTYLADLVLPSDFSILPSLRRLCSTFVAITRDCSSVTGLTERSMDATSPRVTDPWRSTSAMTASRVSPLNIDGFSGSATIIGTPPAISISPAEHSSDILLSGMYRPLAKRSRSIMSRMSMSSLTSRSLAYAPCLLPLNSTDTLPSPMENVGIGNLL